MTLRAIISTSSQSVAQAAIKAGSVRSLKTTSTIRPDPKWFVSKKERGTGALYFYNNLKKAGVKRMNWRWASLVCNALFPELKQVAISAKTASESKGIWKSAIELWTQSGIQATVTVKKNSERKVFEVTVPILVGHRTSFPAGFAKFAWAVSGDKNYVSDDHFKSVLNEYETKRIGETMEFAASSLKETPMFSALELNHLKSANGKLIVKAISDYTAAFLSLEFTQRESEFLCNSPWIEIRPLDFYGVMRSWVDGGFGQFERSPAFSIPLTKIVKATKGVAFKPRLSEDGILIDHHGDYIAIPAELNSIDQYEEAATAAYQRDDGTFSAVSEDMKLRRPPGSMPVFVDWVNLKFAYTNNVGKLEVADLDRSQPVSVSHIKKLLDKRLDSDVAKSLVTIGLGMAELLNLWGQAGRFSVQDLYLEIETINRKFQQYANITVTPLRAIKDFAETEAFYATRCAQFIRILEQAVPFIEQNPVNAYARYSVITIMTFMGAAKLFVKYVDKYHTDIKVADAQLRDAYYTQGEDPSFQLAPLPYVKDDPENPRGLLPHQFKLANMLRKEPDNAILPVDAGGGKTTVIVTETLKMMKGNSQFLGLVMCPAHLVAQYVKEFAYFVGNNVNVIVVNGFTIRRHGLEKLQKLISSSPRNTVVVTDFNVITLKKMTLNYGTSSIMVFPVIDFLRQFDFSYVAVDESHFLKNGTARNAAAAKVIIEIQKKRLASGTMAANSMIDLVRQTALMDPSVFGTQADFTNEYALETRGTKVVRWKEGAEIRVKRVLQENVVVAEAKRKEWAAILPEPKEKIHIPEFSSRQLKVYNDLMQGIKEEILRKAQDDERLKALLSGETPEDEDELDIEGLLKPYLARLEMYTTAPGEDPLGKEVLDGEDLVSPKINKIVEIIREHLDSNTPGKILIFTNYTIAAEEIYNRLPDDLREMAIHYLASNKLEDGAEFERNPNKKIMVGVEQSMNTGLNLQFCSRLIRDSSVWTPGVLEQGNSRVGRPNVKTREARPFVYVDWLVVNNTVDVTKMSYLMAKTIAVAKFYEAGNPRFDELEVPTLMSMTLDTIFTNNNAHSTLLDYAQAYQAYQQAVHAEREEFKAANMEKLFDENGQIKMARLERAENPEGSELMHDIVYTPGLEQDGLAEMGLIRYDAFLKIDPSELEIDDGDDSEGEEEEEDEKEELSTKDRNKLLKIARRNAERKVAIGLKAHTDKGDGEIIRVGFRFVWIKAADGSKIKSHKLATFIYSKPVKIKGDLRTTLLQTTSPDIKIDNPAPDLGKTKGRDRIKEREKRIEEDAEQEHEDVTVEMQLEFTIINDFLGIRLLNHEDESAAKVAQGMGFVHPPSYFATRIKQPRVLQQFFLDLKAKGFDVPKENSRACFQAWEHFRTNKGTTWYGFATKNDFKNFYRMQIKPNPNKMVVTPYPLIQDGALYIAMPATGHPGSMHAIRKVRTVGLKWFQFDSDVEMVAFAGTKPAASQIIKNLLAEGVSITNLKDLKKQFQSLRLDRQGSDE